MRFKKIELVGFKSFADKTVLDFSSGITAILGPNGCGKSNIVDAVKWVLGEQKAKSLRGSEMADVIFSGSERRKPMGMAEVNLFFDNEDGVLPVEFNEVCVTRRLYRSGESEYLINKQRCRLRDIKDLFMDTGIGTSAYSFIEQGKVEALLAAKPTERRIVFEEAAGISKYKARRKETLSRLDRTEQYLLRVNDIVEEVEKRIRSVSRQAQSAKRFQRLSDELKVAKGRLYVCKWEKENVKSDDIKSKISELSQLKSREEILSGTIGAKLTELQKQEMDIEEKLASHEKALFELQQEVTKGESEKARVQERMLSLEKESANLLEQAQVLRSRLENIDQEKGRLGSEKGELEKTTNELAQKIESVNAGHLESVNKITELEKELENSRESLSEIRNQKGALNADKARFESEHDTLSTRKETIKNRNESLFTRRDTLNSEVTGLRTEFEGFTATENELKEKLVEFKQKADNLRTSGEECAQNISKFENEKSAKESRLNTLQELENSMAGFFRGVRSAIEAWKNGVSDCRDIEGVVADLFSVNQDYALAIETALGSSQQSIITNTAYGAKSTIEYLKRERLGRVTILPLDKIKSHSKVDSRFKSMQGVVGEAIDLVTFDSKYYPAAEYLLNGILIIENLDRALQLRDEGANFRMVTLDGDVINPAGAMTGGKDNSQKAGLITRKSEMDELSAAINEIDSKLADIVAKRDRIIAMMLELNNNIRSSEEELAETSLKSRETENTLSAKVAELGGLQEEASGIDAELREIDERINGIAERSSELTGKEEELVNQETLLSERITKISPELSELKNTANEVNSALTQTRVEYAEKVQKLQDVCSRIESLERDVVERLDEAEYCEQKAKAALEEKTSLVSKSTELESFVGEWLSKRNNSENQLNEFRQELGNLRAELEEKRTEERATNKRITDTSESISALKIEERECSMRLESVLERVREELELNNIDALREMLAEENEEYEEDYINDLDDAEDSEEADVDSEANQESEVASESAEPVEFSEKDLETIVFDLQEKIRKIGPVNHQAIEELAELKARSEFLGSERDDLDNAREDLENLINRLNDECRKKFDETFNSVKENFQLLFRRLFGGGKADLILEDNDDPLDAGIEIIARPPGKEPKSISLLSGGEKALCAVALLFAIFRSKPSPFCILDEVDGPLDESNIDRYMDAVREFSQESQFIIITHSKRTMSMTDIIYGVTQSEPGVSKKMSLKFDKEETEQELEEAGTGVA